MFNKKTHKLNGIQSIFSIKDLENISGIKAHTIRIWEKRYGLLTPNRTDTNIRYYSLEDLQKLLNIILLNNKNYRISKIAQMSDGQIKIKVRELSLNMAGNVESINSLKISMFQFDSELFNKTYSYLLSKITFSELFKEIFMPFLNHIGLLWQTDTIAPAHEHFISNLIVQKIQIQIESIQTSKNMSDKMYILFLPEGEIHEIGLLYLSYELVLRGYNVVYLGKSLPIEDLKYFIRYKDVAFLTTMTVKPYYDDLEDYFNEIQYLISDHMFYAIINRNSPPFVKKIKSNIKVFNSPVDFVDVI